MGCDFVYIHYNKVQETEIHLYPKCVVKVARSLVYIDKIAKADWMEITGQYITPMNSKNLNQNMRQKTKSHVSLLSCFMFFDVIIYLATWTLIRS